MAEFNVGRTVAVLSITFYTEGLAIGPLLLAPIADRYGRRWVYVGAASCLLAFGVGAAAAPNLATHLVCRLFAGCIGSVGIAIGGGSIADLWPDGPARQGSLLLFVLASFLSPSLAPLAGAYVIRAQQDDWRWSQWLLVMVGVPIWLLILPMHETGQTKERPSRVRATLQSICFPVRMLCTDIIAILLTVHTSFGYGVIFSFFLSFRSILNRSYGFDDRETSLAYLSLLVGYGLAIVIHALMDRRSASAAQRHGITYDMPESRLRSSVVGGILVCFGEVWWVRSTENGPT
jgi:MFS family permease